MEVEAAVKEVEVEVEAEGLEEAGLGSGTPPTCPANGGSGIVDITAIVIVVVNVATYGITSTTATHISGAPTTPTTTISPLKRLRYLIICRVTTDLKIPAIWMEVSNTSTKQVDLAFLVQYLLPEILACHRDYLGHSDPLHCSVLYTTS